MRGLKRDTVSAIVLLLFTGTMSYYSFDIAVTDYSTLQPSVWPRLILAALGVASALLLVRSAAAPADDDEQAEAPEEETTGAWLLRYSNPLWVFALFLAFVGTMRWLGMLLGGVLFVFLALTVLGRNDVRSVLIHVAIAVLSVGIMWAIFTFGLQVLLPAGKVLPRV